MEAHDHPAPTDVPPRAPARAPRQRSPWRPPEIVPYGSLRHLVRGASGKVGDPAPGFIGKRKMN